MLIMLIGLGLFTACGGGGNGSGNSQDSSSGSGGQALSPKEINVSKAIEDGNITGYDSDDPIAQQYLAVVNYFRGLPVKCEDDLGYKGPVDTLALDDNLIASAKEHSDDMNITEHYAHDGSGKQSDITAQEEELGRGSYFNERIAHHGYDGDLTAENIATANANYELPKTYWISVMEAWMKSKHGHCSNIMNSQLKDFGMYETRSGQKSDGNYYIYWTQDFGGDSQ